MARSPATSFQPSASGHSLARIDTMFRGSSSGSRDAARPRSGNARRGRRRRRAVLGRRRPHRRSELGFPARVVVGARLTAADDGAPHLRGRGLPRGDVAAWTEVLSDDGAWSRSMSRRRRAVRRCRWPCSATPRTRTDVRPESAEEVVPPDPVQQDAATPRRSRRRPSGLDLAPLWAAVAGRRHRARLVALVLGPFLVVVAAKSSAPPDAGGGDDPVAHGRRVGGIRRRRPSTTDRPRPQLRRAARLPRRTRPRRRRALAAAADRAVFAARDGRPGRGRRSSGASSTRSAHRLSAATTSVALDGLRPYR